jgi:hypothetical protein
MLTYIKLLIELIIGCFDKKEKRKEYRYLILFVCILYIHTC